MYSRPDTLLLRRAPFNAADAAAAGGQ
jgi:hypothetical protein